MDESTTSGVSKGSPVARGEGRKGGSGIPATALVIDDEVAIALFFEEILTDLGFDVTTANSFADGQKCLDAGTWDLVLADKNLPDGNGMEQLGPPVVGSEWVNGSHERLAAILLQGMMGTIKVAGKEYTPAAAMPGLKLNPAITDEHLADVATFVRHAWGNGKNAVKADTFTKVRKELADRETVFSPEELVKAFP